MLAAQPTSPSTLALPASAGGSIWESVQCNQNSIDDPTVDYASRWNAADVPGAWNAMLSTWNGEAHNNMYRGLTFPQFASYYFSGPEQWNCQDIGSVQCSTTVQCKDVTHPAGYLLLNAFSGIHQLHSEMHGAIQTSTLEVLSKIGEFTGVFSPQQDNSKAILQIFDIFTTLFGFALPVMFNVVEKDIANAASTAVPVLTELGFKWDGYIVDMTYQLYSIGGAWARNNAPKVADKLGAQNTLSSALGDIFTAWKDMEVNYLKSLFSGGITSQIDLQNLIGDGKANFLPNHLDQDQMAANLVTTIYGQMIPNAWKTAVIDGGSANPFIVKSDVSCDNHSASLDLFKDGIGFLMGETDAANTRVCYNGKLVFILHAKEWNGLSNVKFTPLPGADSSTLSGGKWGNITMDDIATSALTGYEQLGNNQNGYKTPDMDAMMKDPEALQYKKMVRYPGFFNIPVCESVEQAKENIKANHEPNSPYWPCAEPAGFNKKGTTVHVNKGYINVNNKPVCDWFNIPDPGYGQTLNATFYGRFNGDNTADSTVQATCKLSTTWEKWLTDIYYGEDNCLYNDQSDPMKGEDGNHACCNETPDLEMVANPYVSGVQCQH
ncbi:hypothetical protein N7517_009673 [Penicillium concentricum]|uniref:Uncharacterized protein n=1 Tax=Penicillium concentricum TaxID=293559 RepID=A0A9W9RI10_9EURO|nr:uncharacterized protein N7517_009673 [Penicillium concentricum]KAJ5360482.1 hypothetical protein N7517_009673 [Penicillium concentricum]